MIMGAPLTIPRRLLTLDEYHTIGAAGVLKEDDRIELIEGEMIEMAPIGSRHVAKVNRLARLLSQCVGDQAIVSVQNPIALPPHNEPQPDIALLKPRADDYEGKLPGAQDILLVIEVSDTTLAYDRDSKMPIYAHHGIIEAWLVDVPAETLSIFLAPGASGYQRTLAPGRSESVTPALLPNVVIRLHDLWK
jgi:Uma2 family endonuclease